MKHIRKVLAGVIVAAVTMFAPLGTATVQAATAAQIREAQTIMTKFGIPTGPIDGLFGGQTGRGLCAFRMMSGLPVSRANLDTTTLTRLRSYNSSYARLTSIPAASLSGRTTYLLAHQHCQAMLYAEAGRYHKVMAISTGISTHRTPNGAYSLGGTQRGWSCSTIYPESCTTQNVGRFASISNYGNMYNKRLFRSGGYYVHGSTSVPTTPASHGCVRVTVNDSDWMYDRVGNSGPTYFVVTGAY